MGFEIESCQLEQQNQQKTQKQQIDLYSTVGAEFYVNEVAHLLHYHFMLIGRFGSILMSVWEGKEGLLSLVRSSHSFKCIPIVVGEDENNLQSVLQNSYILLKALRTFQGILAHECRMLGVNVGSFDESSVTEHEITIRRLELKPSVVIQMERDLTYGPGEIVVVSLQPIALESTNEEHDKVTGSIASTSLSLLKKEIVASEEEYLLKLQAVTQLISKNEVPKKMLFSGSFFSKPKVLSKAEIGKCFVNIPTIIQIHSEFLASEMNENAFEVFVPALIEEYTQFFSVHQNALFWVESLRKTHLSLNVAGFCTNNELLSQFFGMILKRPLNYLHWTASLGLQKLHSSLSKAIDRMQELSKEAEAIRKTDCFQEFFPSYSLGTVVTEISLSEGRALFCSEKYLFLVKGIHLSEGNEIPWSFLWMLAKGRKEHVKFEVAPIPIEQSNLFYLKSAQKFILGDLVLKKFVVQQEHEAMRFVEAWRQVKNKNLFKDANSLAKVGNVLYCNYNATDKLKINSLAKPFPIGTSKETECFCFWNPTSQTFLSKLKLLATQKQQEESQSSCTQTNFHIPVVSIERAHDFVINYVPAQRNTQTFEAYCKWLVKCYTKEESFSNKIKSTISRISSLSLNRGSSSMKSRISTTLDSSQSFFKGQPEDSLQEHSPLFNSPNSCPNVAILMEAFDEFITQLQINPTLATTTRNANCKKSALSPEALLNGKERLTLQIANSLSFPVLIECLKVALKEASAVQVHEKMLGMKHRNVFAKYFASHVQKAGKEVVEREEEQVQVHE